MEYRLLGPVEVMTDTGPVRLGSAKQRSLLAVLALSVGRAVTVERLVDALWGEHPPEDAGGALRFHVHRLRKALAPVGAEILTRSGGYVLDAEPGAIDLVQVDRLSSEGRRVVGNDPAAAAELFRRALDLWRGPPLADVAGEPFAAPEIARLEELHRSLTERWLRAELDAGGEAPVVAELERLVGVEPLDEHWWALLMLALYRAGRQADALAAYQQARAVLADELGLDPSPELRHLEARILAQEPTLDRTATGSPAEVVPEEVSCSPPERLPEWHTRFVGREDDLSELDGFLATRRLITLTGVGGAGKTRLAVEAARRVAWRFPGGAHFADLSALDDGAGLGAHVVAELAAGRRLGETPTTSVEEAVSVFTRGRRTLIVLDNCEHLLDATAALVGRLLAVAPELVVLATSREALGVDGEQIWPVGPLSLPDRSSPGDGEAVELLVDRMRLVRPQLVVDPDVQATLTEICLALDGIPLALELAAARAAHLEPAEIVHRLADRLHLLDGGPRRAARQQTLRSTVDWSHDLLDPDEQAVLRRLAVFTGGFTLDAAEGICMQGIGRPAVDVLASLVAKSLVALGPAGEGRYRLLETVRLYAEERLGAAGDTAETRSRHRDWFLARLEAHPLERCLLSDEFAVELEADADNLRSALGWCAAQKRPDLLRRFLVRLPSFSSRWLDPSPELQGWFDQALAYEQSLPRHQWFCHVRAEGASAWGWSGDPAKTEASIVRLAALTEHLPDREPITAYAHLQIASLLGAFPKRAAAQEEAADHAIRHAEPENELLVMFGMRLKASACLYDRRYAEAAELLEACQRSPVWEYARLLAVVRHLQGRHREAHRLIVQQKPSANASVQRGDLIIEAVVTAALGDLPAAQDRLRAAVDGVHSERGLSHPLAYADLIVGFAALADFEGDTERTARLVAAVPGSATSSQALFMLLRHHRDRAREALDTDTRERCIEEGRTLVVDDAIDLELARWDEQAVIGGPPTTP